MHKNTQITFREQDTETPKQFSQQIQNFHNKKSDYFTNQEQTSQHSLMEGRIQIQNQIPHLKR
jgi:protein-tyrosine-phosphatase